VIEVYEVPPPSVWGDGQPEPTCKHEYSLRRRIIAGGGVVYLRQCDVCGEKGQAIKHATLTDDEKAAAVPYDPDLEPRVWVSKLEAWQLEHEARQRTGTPWSNWYYYGYLQSATWKKRKDAAMKREHYLCGACGCERATHVHHLTYEHVGQERLWELIAVCAECHDDIHNGVSV
jgi:5-methylcytosine-specific restriction endonuclease McrA